VLFTSGSETQPKAVPLSHGNLLTNSRDLLSVISLRNSEAFLGMLPPFHSFGLTVNILVPLLSGMRAVYYPNPLEARVLASLIEAYQVTTLAGTPTFLAGICRAAQPGQLDSVRWAVTGAEKCPARVYDALAGSCPRALVLEGYGITECSPVVSVNRPERAKRETIGVVLPSLEYAIVEPETGEKVIPGTRGMLLVRGPSVFHGYLEHSGDSCFVEHGGRQWYRTGDLVSEDTDQVLTFQGRLKRFVKLGGEMISLPAIEAVLGQHVAQTTPQRDGPAVAVECSSGQEHTELVLFTSLGLEREEANRVLRDAGLSPLHHIRRVVRLDQLPVLGTGKVDYRALKDLANQH
jgi:long-chain-fatty-acid--[acyl-carrier-protein] ligase